MTTRSVIDSGRHYLETGPVVRLNTPGLTLDSNVSFVGQDDTRRLLWNNGALLSLRKL